ncbi:hypothetical protein [Flagellimonas sp.]|uniref:hypothetical protein n=1 Tax=Flagellimonas sp. TaxID=2058762 RepID=UPI003BAC9A82
MKKLELIMVFVVGVLTLITTYKWKEINLLGKLTLILAIFLAAIVLINAYKAVKKEALIEKVEAKFGDINTKGAKQTIMMLGNRDDGTRVNLLDGVFIMRGLDNKPFIKLEVVNDKLMVNVVIRDLSGKVIAVIEDSTWTVFDDDYEYNDVENAFELVTKGERNVFFQTFYFNKTIYFSGYLINDKGAGAVIYNIKRTPSSSILEMADGKNKKLPKPSEVAIPRMFKYPREKYYGQFDKTSSYFR